MQRSKSNSPGLKTGVKRDFFFHFRIIRDWGQETIKWGERSRLEGILSKSNEVMVASAATFPKGFAVSVTVSPFLWIWLPGLCGYVPEHAPLGTLQSPLLQPHNAEHPCIKKRLQNVIYLARHLVCVVQTFTWELAMPASMYYQWGAAGAHEAQLSSTECKCLSYAKSVYFFQT